MPFSCKSFQCPVAEYRLKFTGEPLSLASQKDLPLDFINMRYIESLELREWVKDNLRKTIFQKVGIFNKFVIMTLIQKRYILSTFEIFALSN